MKKEKEFVFDKDEEKKFKDREGKERGDKMPKREGKRECWAILLQFLK